MYNYFLNTKLLTKHSRTLSTLAVKTGRVGVYPTLPGENDTKS